MWLKLTKTDGQHEWLDSDSFTALKQHEDFDAGGFYTVVRGKNGAVPVRETPEEILGVMGWDTTDGKL